MANNEAWFIEERAGRFASFLLTKNEDVVLRDFTVRFRSDRAAVIDFLAEVRQGRKPTMRFFGVQLLGWLSLPSTPSPDQELMERLPGERFDVTLPLCLFLIDVRKPEGSYRWVVEPVIQDGRPVLIRSKESEWQALDEPGVERLIRQVNEWYDALQSSVVPK